LSAVAQFLGIEREEIYTRTRRRQRARHQYRKAAAGPHKTAVVEEAGLRFEVNFTDYLDVGLFLDHREVRKRIRNASRGKRFLNLFAYTCTASVYAAAGGARETVSVDTSRRYLDWGKRNFELNGLGLEAHSFVEADAVEFLEGGGGIYDLMLIDPPTFSNSKDRESDFDVQLDHERLLEVALARLAENGEIIFSTNFRSFRLSEDVREWASVADISEESLPPDFARSAGRKHVYLIEKADRR
jgi:23S rRNA (guanine2445-N2)-methyltransferase / 23S rRNA (guanine2069-N7)-methyltransferase